MFACLFFFALMSLSAAPELPAHGAIEAVIRGTAQPIDVTLLRRDGEAWTAVEHRSLGTSARTVHFEPLTAGVYQILIRGLSSTEQLATKVVIGDGDTRRAEITIDPVTVTGRVTFGGRAAGPGVVSLRHKEFQWRGLVTVEPDGSFHAPLWQRGTYLFSVREASIASFTGTIDLKGVSPIAFPIEVPDARISGIVHEAKSGAPVSGVSVALQTDSAEGTQHVNTVTDSAGRFGFNGLRTGRQTVRIVSAGHLEPSPIVFELDAAKASREVDILLDGGRSIPITVLDADEHPVANATVFTVAGARRRSRATTDQNGSTNLAIPTREGSSLFVIPDAGGFATMQLAPTQSGRLTVHLPRAASSLRIRARTTDGKPMPNFSLLMRYNGEVMPLEISDELSVQGLQFATKDSEAYLQNIPAGAYDFWPYRTKEEADSIIAASSDVAPPIHVDVHSGENTIVVKFAAR